MPNHLSSKRKKGKLIFYKTKELTGLCNNTEIYY